MTDDAALAFVDRCVEVPFDGAAVQVRPLTVGQCIALSAELESVLPALGPAIAAVQGGGDVASALVSLLATRGVALLSAVNVCTGISIERLQASRDIAGLVALIVAIVKLNMDFFAQQAGAVRSTLAGALSASGDGQTASTASAPAATY